MIESQKTAWSWGPSFRRNEIVALLAILGVAAFLALDAILEGAPFGHDESVYAVMARTMFEGASRPSVFADYRAPGLPALLQPMWLIRADEPALRSYLVLFGLVGIVLTWLIGRYLFGRRVGLVAAAGLALTNTWVVASTHVWPDVPGATLGLIAIAILLFGSSGDRLSPWVLLAVPVVVLATVVRFGAPIPILVAGLSIAGWRRHVVFNSKPLFVTLVAFAGAGVVTVLATKVLQGTRTPLDALTDFSPAGDNSITASIVGYAKAFGKAVDEPPMLALFLGTSHALITRWRRPDQREFRLIAAIAVGTAVLLMIVLHAELRYLAPVIPLWWMIAAVGITDIASRIDRTSVVMGGAVFVLAAAVTQTVISEADATQFRAWFNPLREIATATDWPDDCDIATSYSPQVQWYTECDANGFLEQDNPIRQGATHVFVLLEGKRQPENLGPYLSENGTLIATEGEPWEGRLVYIEIWELDAE